MVSSCGPPVTPGIAPIGAVLKWRQFAQGRGCMEQSQREKRLRLLVKRVNKERKRQAEKIDILCNDLIEAHREFIRRLGGISFAAHFYKSLVGAADPQNLLSRAARSLQEELSGANISFFLRRIDGPAMQVSQRHETLLVGERPLEERFDADLVESICKANKPCTAEDMFGMGLIGNPQNFKCISLATLPLTDLGRSLGFLLLSRPVAQPLTDAELRKAGMVLRGLSHALAGCRLPIHSTG
jgi:hypothetical protein